MRLLIVVQVEAGWRSRLCPSQGMDDVEQNLHVTPSRLPWDV